MNTIKDRIKIIIPDWLLIMISPFIHPIGYYKNYLCKRDYKKRLSKVAIMHSTALRSLKNKEQIKCVFLSLFDSTWKYDSVYKMMEKHNRFCPIILICPIVNYGNKNMLERMESCYYSFMKRGYNVLKAYDAVSGNYIDLRKDLQPDIIFYTNPYKGLIDDRYYIDNFDDILTVYVSYNYGNSKDFNMFFNLPLHNLVWRFYLETEIHKTYAVSYSDNHGKNAVVTGYPGIETLISPSYKPKDVWLDKEHTKKRIIWAPHHSIEPVGLVYYSCFLKYKDFMLYLAKKYVNEIELFFKPHPLLKNKLYEYWGHKRTDDYYALWDDGPNIRFVDGDYTDLFLTSDAMIHDSGSFLIEYLYLNKPVMRTSNGEDPNRLYNGFTIDCLDYYYHAYSEADIEQFIQNVINGVDPLKEQRTHFVNDVLMPKGGLPSENIVNDILDSIESQRV